MGNAVSPQVTPQQKSHRNPVGAQKPPQQQPQPARNGAGPAQHQKDSKKIAAGRKGLAQRRANEAARQRGEVLPDQFSSSVTPEKIRQEQRRAFTQIKKLRQTIEKRLRQPDEITPTGLRTILSTLNQILATLKHQASELAGQQCPKCSAGEQRDPTSKTPTILELLNRAWAQENGLRYRKPSQATDPREEGEVTPAEPNLSKGADYLES